MGRSPPQNASCRSVFRGNPSLGFPLFDCSAIKFTLSCVWKGEGCFAVCGQRWGTLSPQPLQAFEKSLSKTFVALRVSICKKGGVSQLRPFSLPSKWDSKGIVSLWQGAWGTASPTIRQSPTIVTPSAAAAAVVAAAAAAVVIAAATAAATAACEQQNQNDDPPDVIAVISAHSHSPLPCNSGLCLRTYRGIVCKRLAILKSGLSRCRFLVL